ncbi:Hypothetical_protein [Hexamita inflata]|uniref:Hypothetical_protein n=1 Tax=Hexamita inflata TaxID=28002 RepID=A0AA86NLZ2_9EUKA|nr:Hypothetical protein HINF_LOCUS10045 [Hexamita inflata]
MLLQSSFQYISNKKLEPPEIPLEVQVPNNSCFSLGIILKLGTYRNSGQYFVIRQLDEIADRPSTSFLQILNIHQLKLENSKGRFIFYFFIKTILSSVEPHYLTTIPMLISPARFWFLNQSKYLKAYLKCKFWSVRHNLNKILLKYSWSWQNKFIQLITTRQLISVQTRLLCQLIQIEHLKPACGRAGSSDDKSYFIGIYSYINFGPDYL